MENKRIRVLIAKVGLDGHDRGAKVVARALMEAGMEVIYTGLRQPVDKVVSASVQENVDVVGLSFMAGDHMVLVPKIVAGLSARRKTKPLLLVGGIILKNEIGQLEAMGIDRVFGPGTFPRDIVAYIENCFEKPHLTDNASTRSGEL
jgi:methylmalonyl-CoA mutase C-terminal domain/subunit